MTPDFSYPGVGTKAGRALLDDLAPIQTFIPGEANSLEWADRQAFADRIASIEQEARSRVGVLTHDNGEFDAYVAYYDDPDRLEEAVKRLNAERWDTEAMEPVQAEARTVTVIHVPDVIDDDFLDQMAMWLEDAGVYVESAAEAEERRAEEEADEESAALPPVPGQITLDGRVVE
jgi:hypothetical protein